jgi:hypothetical protein
MARPAHTEETKSLFKMVKPEKIIAQQRFRKHNQGNLFM